MLILKKVYTNQKPENWAPWESLLLFFSCTWPVAVAILSGLEVSLERRQKSNYVCVRQVAFSFSGQPVEDTRVIYVNKVQASNPAFFQHYTEREIWRDFHPVCKK